MVSLVARTMFIVFIVYILRLGDGFMVVISRNGGSRSRRHKYVLAEKNRRVNTCSLARMVLPTIKIGKCPATFDDYRHLYSRDSMSFLDSYYKKHCDIVYIREPNFGDRYITPLIGLTFMLMALLLFISCITGVVVKIYATATKFLTSVGN